MLSVKEAKQIIKEKIKPLKGELKPLSVVCGFALAEDIFANVDVPMYPQSSMDGYALRYEDLGNFPSLTIKGKMQAGSDEDVMLQPGEAVRIFTGAPVPPSADTIVMQEKTKVEGDQLFVMDVNIMLGTNVRGQGSEIKKGDLGLNKGQIISPAGIGFLASVGVNEVKVIMKPRVTIIVTGDELQEIGQPLSYGQVYESNSHTVKAVLLQMGIYHIEIKKVKDTLQELTEVLAASLEKSDVVLLTGGISAGEYDFVSEATKACGVEQIFHKLKQKPGKPIFFGMQGEKVVFGLPGNPASVLTCLYQYVTIALDQLSGTNLGLQKLKVPINAIYKKPQGITHFLKGYYNGEKVNLLDGQESYKLNSFAKSNCLIEIAEEVNLVEKDDYIIIHLIP
jgi:molybdopterin molybdotransferase